SRACVIVPSDFDGIRIVWKTGMHWSVMRGILKEPLLIAAGLVVLRIITEQAGAPDVLNNLISVATFYVLIAPIYFALRIANSGIDPPYRTLLKTVGLFAFLARAMVIPTYWLAYVFQWPQKRFSTAAGGVVGPGVTPMMAYAVVPAVALVIWVFVSLV